MALARGVADIKGADARVPICVNRWSTAETVEVTGPSASSRTTPAAVAASTVAAPATSAAAVAATAVAVAETAVAVAATAVAVAAAPNDRQVLFLALAGPYREGGR